MLSFNILRRVTSNIDSVNFPKDKGPDISVTMQADQLRPHKTYHQVNHKQLSGSALLEQQSGCTGAFKVVGLI